MKYIFGSIFVALIFLSSVAWWLKPQSVRDRKTTLVWVTHYGFIREEQIALFNKLHSKCQVRLDPTNHDTAKIIVQSLAGVGPDLFECGRKELGSFVKAGIAWDITDELVKAGIDIKKDIWELACDDMIYGGRVYAFPRDVSVEGLWFNKDIFDQYRIPYPKGSWKWENLIPLAKKLTVYDEKGRIKHFGFVFETWQWPNFVVQWGGKIYTKDGTRCVLDSPEVIAAIQFMHDLIYVHRVAPTPAEESGMAVGDTGQEPLALRLFASGKAAMALGGRWWLCTLRRYKNLHLGLTLCPHGPSGWYRGQGQSAAINRYSPRKEGALEFIKYLAGKEYNELVNHQADAIAPVKKFLYTSKFLHDPDYPQEDYNHLWQEGMELGISSQEISPFVEPTVAGRIVSAQLDLVKGNHKTAAEAMKTAAQEINNEIQKNLKLDPSLRAEYQASLDR